MLTDLVLLHPGSIAELLRVDIPQQFPVHHAQLLCNLTATVQVELLRQRGGATVDGGRGDTPTGAGEGVVKIQGNLRVCVLRGEKSHFLLLCFPVLCPFSLLSLLLSLPLPLCFSLSPFSLSSICFSLSLLLLLLSLSLLPTAPAHDLYQICKPNCLHALLHS